MQVAAPHYHGLNTRELPCRRTVQGSVMALTFSPQPNQKDLFLPRGPGLRQCNIMEASGQRTQSTQTFCQAC